MLKANLLLFCALSFLSGCSQKVMLFPVSVDNKIGYIDSTGKMIIPPQFFAGGEFTDGLAAVRKDGLYGYINQKGKLAVPAVYDFAADFYKGIAVVYNGDQPLFIDENKKEVLPNTIVSCRFTDDDRAIIQTKSGRLAIMNLHNHRILVDTLYGKIGAFNNGLTIVEEFSVSKKNAPARLAVIDSAGYTLVPFGTYEEIKPYSDGYAVVEKGKDEHERFGIIDQSGKPVFFKSLNRGCWPGDAFHNGLAKINLYKYWIPEDKGVISQARKIMKAI